MTLPSHVLDAIVRGFKAQLIDEGQPKVYAAVIDDATLGDITEYNTVPTPSILLSSTGIVLVPEEPGLVEVHLIARCVARLSEKPGNPSQDIRSRGDVAFNLAGFVVRSLDDGTAWLDDGGLAIEKKRAERVQARNLGSRALASKGLCMWVVSWQQQFQIAAEDVPSILHSFKHLSMTFQVGDDATPDISAELELEGGTPP